MVVVMRRITVTLVALLVFIGLPSAYATGNTTTEETEFSETIPFTIVPGPDGCNQIDRAISGTAVIYHKVRTTTYPDGSRRIVDDGFSKGAAVDDDGRSYRYRYENRAILNVPPAGPLVIVEMRDKFTLRGRGSANRIDASFNWLWTFQPGDLNNVLADFAFPPVDNWVQFETSGDPLNCDPI
jgi:hypothetical protein